MISRLERPSAVRRCAYAIVSACPQLDRGASIEYGIGLAVTTAIEAMAAGSPSDTGTGQAPQSWVMQLQNGPDLVVLVELGPAASKGTGYVTHRRLGHDRSSTPNAAQAVSSLKSVRCSDSARMSSGAVISTALSVMIACE